MCPDSSLHVLKDMMSINNEQFLVVATSSNSKRDILDGNIILGNSLHWNDGIGLDIKINLPGCQFFAHDLLNYDSRDLVGSHLDRETGRLAHLVISTDNMELGIVLLLVILGNEIRGEHQGFGQHQLGVSLITLGADEFDESLMDGNDATLSFGLFLEDFEVAGSDGPVTNDIHFDLGAFHSLESATGSGLWCLVGVCWEGEAVLQADFWCLLRGKNQFELASDVIASSEPEQEAVR